MENDREKLEEIFEKLDPESQADVLAHVRVAYAAQENTKRRLGRPGPSDPAYAMPGSGPRMGGASLAREALNG